jgi:hypothetical protein
MCMRLSPGRLWRLEVASEAIVRLSGEVRFIVSFLWTWRFLSGQKGTLGILPLRRLVSSNSRDCGFLPDRGEVVVVFRLCVVVVVSVTICVFLGSLGISGSPRGCARWASARLWAVASSVFTLHSFQRLVLVFHQNLILTKGPEMSYLTLRRDQLKILIHRHRMSHNGDARQRERMVEGSEGLGW